MARLVEFLKTWWLPAIAYLLATSPSALVLFFQNSLSPHIAAQSPVTLLNIGTLLLWLSLLLMAFIVLQHPWLRWDATTSTWVSCFTKIRYCAKCRVDKKMSPLGNEDNGWRCPSCGHWCEDPKRPLPPEPPRPTRRLYG